MLGKYLNAIQVRFREKMAYLPAIINSFTSSLSSCIDNKILPWLSSFDQYDDLLISDLFVFLVSAMHQPDIWGLTKGML